MLAMFFPQEPSSKEAFLKRKRLSTSLIYLRRESRPLVYSGFPP
jgi:hypothetical protein